MRKTRPAATESKQTSSAIREPQKQAATSREQLVADLTHEAESLIRSDAVIKQLRSLKKVIPVLYAYLSRERRRKKPSKQLQWLLAEFTPEIPVDNCLLVVLRDLLLSMRMQLEGGELPSDTGEKTLRHLKNLMAIRKEPRYWREYRAYRNGKLVSEILREFHPAYDQLHSWEREKYFRKVYNAIQRLVEKYGGLPLNTPPPQES
jgi:hypothetical protein